MPQKPDTSRDPIPHATPTRDDRDWRAFDFAEDCLIPRKPREDDKAG
ncbi:MAG: hypothetical protein ACRBBU_01290 [Pseudooceanicola sp.]